MSKARWSPKDFKDNGLIEVNGLWVKASTQIAKGRVDKLPLMNNNVNFVTSIEEPKANRKIKNATKSVVDGISFDSNLEKYMYDLLKGAGITFEFQVEYTLQEKFRYNGEAVRAMTLTIDFLLPTRNMIIDCKGYSNDVSPVKYKLLKYILYKGGNAPKIVMPKNKRECDDLLNNLLYL